MQLSTGVASFERMARIDRHRPSYPTRIPFRNVATEPLTIWSGCAIFKQPAHREKCVSEAILNVLGPPNAPILNELTPWISGLADLTAGCSATSW